MIKKYDIAIIGSGLGGLYCSNILSRHGFSVCLVEKNSSIGGCLQDFVRDGYHFDTGIHYIGSYDKHQALRKLFDYLEISDLLSVRKLDSKAFDKVNINGTEYEIPQGVDNFKQQLLTCFPYENVAIETYFADMKHTVESIDLLNFRELNDNEMTIYNDLGISTYEYLHSLTDNQSLIDMLSMFNALSNNQRTTATLPFHFIVSYFYLQSAYKVIGGGRKIADALFQVAQENGIKLLLNSKVEKVNVQDKLITSLSLSNGEKVYADSFISDISPKKMIMMLPPKSMRKSYLNRIKRFKNSISMFTVYLIMEERQFKYNNSNYYYYKDSKAIWRCDLMDMSVWPSSFIMFSTESEKNPGYAKSIIIMSQIEFSEFSKWKNTLVGHRGVEYQQYIEFLKDNLLSVVNNVFPDFSSKIKSYNISTPLTYRDYTGVDDGGMYGTIKDYKNPYGSILNTTTLIKNLILTGQSVNLHGILGVALTSLLSCGSFVNVNELIREINEKEK